MPVKNNHPLDRIFHPESVAVVGASVHDEETGWVARLINFGYGDKGEIYPVNPNADKIHGLKAYPRVSDIPYPVEYAIFNIPSRLTPQAMRDCVSKGVKFVHCYAAGFSETGTEEGKRLEAEMVKIAQEGGIRLLGPNCMGIYSPDSGLTFNEEFPKEKGRIAFVSQSGAESTRLIFLIQDVNLHFSKVVSYGNASDLDAHDFLEYLAQDEETDVIALYIEGVKNGPRFMSAIKKCMDNKPVVILKAGLTESGAGAAASHTASMAGAKAIWDSFFKQTGVIPALTMDEVADIIQGLVRIKKPQGRRVAVIGRGGGIGVIASDICERAGLKVPPFSRETQQKLLNIIPEAGAGMRNPVETMVGMGGAADFYLRGLSIVDEDPDTDIILVHMAIDVYGGHTIDLVQQVSDSSYALCAIADSIKKPMAVALFPGGHPDTLRAVGAARDNITKCGIPVFSGVESASRAFSKIYNYYQYFDTHR